MSTEDDTCIRCGKPIDHSKSTWLELDTGTGFYHEFGTSCAKAILRNGGKMIRIGRAKEKPMKTVYLLSPKGQLYRFREDGSISGFHGGRLMPSHDRLHDSQTFAHHMQRRLDDGWTRVVARPTQSTLSDWQQAGIAESVDGCHVKPNGICKHGKPSWFIALGMITVDS